MAAIGALRIRLQKHLAMYERGILTATECSISFVELMLDADNDDACLSLCTDLPEWFRDKFLKELNVYEEMGFYRRHFAIGDVRTEAEKNADALFQQDLLRRLTPRIRMQLEQNQDR